MSHTQAKAIVQRYLKQAVSGGSTTAIDALVSPRIVFHSPYTPQPIQGREGFK